MLELQQELNNTKELLRKLLQTPPGSTVDQAAIHALLRRPATFEIDSSASKQRASPKAEKFGLVSEDGMRALFGGGGSAAAGSKPPPASQPDESSDPSQQPVHEQAAQVQELPTHSDLADTEAAQRAEEHAEADTADKKEAHNQYTRFYRQVRVFGVQYDCIRPIGCHVAKRLPDVI